LKRSCGCGRCGGRHPDAKAARDLETDFHHAENVFGFVVGKPLFLNPARTDIFPAPDYNISAGLLSFFLFSFLCPVVTTQV
jgi:hypothetical protein